MIKLNPDIERLAAFMQNEFPAESLVSMANIISALAPLLWGKYGKGAKETFVVTSVRSPVDDRPKLAAAI